MRQTSPTPASRARTASLRRTAAALTCSAILALGMLPARAQTSSASLALDRDHGLVGGQWITASWSGVRPGDWVSLRQCTRQPATIRDCSYLGTDAVHSGGAAPASGAGHLSFPVKAVVNGGSATDRFVCDAGHSCSIALFTDAGATNLSNAVIQPIRFAVSSDSCPAPTTTDDVVRGKGTYTISRAFRAWEGRLCRAPRSVFVRYRATSSPRGETAFADGDASFAFTSQPLGASSIATLRYAKRRYAYAPLVGSGLSFGFRMSDATTGEPVTQLRLTPDQLAAIFTGQMHDFGADPDIVAQNPGIDFPPVVRAVGRSDASAQTELLTSWFLAVARHTYRSGGAAYDGGPTLTYPSTGDIALLAGARRVAKAVADPAADPSDVATIGWMDSSVATMYDVPTVQIRNGAGQFVAPTAVSVMSAIRRMSRNHDGVTRSANFRTRAPGAYPLPVVTYMVTQTNVTKGFDETQGDALRTFIRFAADQADADRNDPHRTILPDGYAPLPDSMTTDARRTARALPTTAYSPPDTTTDASGTGFGGTTGGTGFGGTTGGSGYGGSTSGGGVGGTGGGGLGGGTGGAAPGATTTPAASSGPAMVLLPESALASTSGSYVWPIVLIGGIVLLFLGIVMSVGLRLAARHGEKKALAALAADANATAATPDVA